MNASYRIVQFVPDPFSGWRVPVAALVKVGEAVRVVPSPVTPGPACLGGTPRAALFRMISEALVGADNLDHLPAGVGPQAVLEKVHLAPMADLDAAARWVAEFVLPQPVARERSDAARHPAPARRMHGARFFETWQVAEYVAPTFKPDTDWGGRLKGLGAYGSVSHWVGGRDDVLLLEPIVPTRHQFAGDLSEVARLFGAYRFALGQAAEASTEAAPGKSPATLIAYVLSGSDERKADAVSGLKAAHHVIDTDNPGDRARFLGMIRDVGRSGRDQGDIATVPEG